MIKLAASASLLVIANLIIYRIESYTLYNLVKDGFKSTVTGKCLQSFS